MTEGKEREPIDKIRTTPPGAGPGTYREPKRLPWAT